MEHSEEFTRTGSGLNWHLEMFVFEERVKPDYPEIKLLEQSTETTIIINLTHIQYDTGDHALSPLCHSCTLGLLPGLFDLKSSIQTMMLL